MHYELLCFFIYICLIPLSAYYSNPGIPFDSSLHIPAEGQVALGFTPIKIPVVQLLGMMGKHSFSADTEIEDKPLYCHWKTKERSKFLPIGKSLFTLKDSASPFLSSSSAAGGQEGQEREGWLICLAI